MKFQRLVKRQHRVKEVLPDNHRAQVQKVQVAVDEQDQEEVISTPIVQTNQRKFLSVGDLSELSQNPQFLALRQLIQQNPEQLQTLMQTLQATQPELYQLIEQRPQEFLELLNQEDEGDDDDGDDLPQAGGQGPPGTVTITLSPQDQQAINRVRFVVVFLLLVD